ncbi:hypothetical protein PG911_05940 [Tenacibaculum ovolyticum]|uniref:hypothetical protein n=1 Tax=Tenacibaculum ovolyticum TaxID=104270 RepID=UPI001F409ADA|nr:hypothetical protein [Tenacibaculum ovolyticum]WBX77799.1 hypothetical protein PG911_05940 [Tenacibaculum ovolyticum]
MTYYHGYVYDTNENPIEGLILRGRDHKGDKSTSNKLGYFKIYMRKNWVERYIYIYRKNALLDSIQVTRTHPEYGSRYYFVEGRNDTLFINMSKR